jgi:hypothetical protein
MSRGQRLTAAAMAVAFLCHADDFIFPVERQIGVPRPYGCFSDWLNYGLQIHGKNGNMRGYDFGWRYRVLPARHGRRCTRVFVLTAWQPSTDILQYWPAILILHPYCCNLQIDNNSNSHALH